MPTERLNLTKIIFADHCIMGVKISFNNLIAYSYEYTAILLFKRFDNYCCLDFGNGYLNMLFYVPILRFDT